MAIVTLNTEDYGYILLNKETNEFVLGASTKESTSFVKFNEEITISRSKFDSDEEYNEQVKITHSELVQELHKDGFGVIYDS